VLQIWDVLSRIRISKFFIPDPDPGIRIRIPEPTGIKRGKKNKTNLFLVPYGFRIKFYQ
jgi:hypothetical protein